MATSPLFRSINLKPLTGVLDTRSLPDAMAPGSWRWRQNVSVSDAGKLCRRAGWRKLMGDLDHFNNQDLHDQLLSLQLYYDERTPQFTPQESIISYPPGSDTNSVGYCGTTQRTRLTGRQPISFLFEAVSTTGQRKLLSGTQNRLYALNESKGNWRIIADNFGGDPRPNLLERKLSAAQVSDTVIFTNGVDEVFSWVFDGATFGCAMQAVSPVASLRDIELTKAGVVAAWRGVIFLADVEMEGERIPQRIVWSDFQSPLDFIPSSASVAGFQDLTYGQQVLAMKPLGDVLLVYTTGAIWQISYVGGEQVFQFRELYSEPENQEACLAYRHTLVSTGQEHIYLARDGIYVFNLFVPKPERSEWIHLGTTELFATLNRDICDAHVAHYDTLTKEYWVSWVETDQTLPVRTLAFNTKNRTADFIDHGFTAFLSYIPDKRPSIRDWLLENLFCTSAELDALGDSSTTPKEGGYCVEPVLRNCADIGEETLTGEDGNDLEQGFETLTGDVDFAETSLCNNRNIPIWTNVPLDVDGMAVEDFNQPKSDSLSLCSILGGMTIEDLCNECNTQGLFVMASATDFALKQNGGVFFREEATAFIPCGTWARRPYKSILRTGAMVLGKLDEETQMRGLELEFDQEPELSTLNADVRVGISQQAVDPNLETGRCALVWRNLTSKALACQSDRSGVEHITHGTRPYRPLNWTFIYTGKYFYVELSINGVGGAYCFSRMTFDARRVPRSANA